MSRRVLLLFVGNLFTLLLFDLKLVLVCGDCLLDILDILVLFYCSL